jgi:hypothetical protein
MKAFLMSLVLLAAITAIAAAGLSFTQRSAGDAFTERGNVRL